MLIRDTTYMVMPLANSCIDCSTIYNLLPLELLLNMVGGHVWRALPRGGLGAGKIEVCETASGSFLRQLYWKQEEYAVMKLCSKGADVWGEAQVFGRSFPPWMKHD